MTELPITLEAEPSTLHVETTEPVTIRVTNHGDRRLRRLDVRLAPDPTLVFVDGRTQITAVELAPGTSVEHRCRLRAGAPGPVTLAVPRVAYHVGTRIVDERGEALRLDVVEPVAPAETPTADDEARPLPSVFISYRRDDDEGFVALLADRLRAALPASNVVVDIDVLQPGDRWRAVLEDRLARMTALLAIITRNWADARLHREDDVLRHEVATGLVGELLVVPVTVYGARLPRRDELPPDLVDLRERQTAPVEQRTLDHDVDRIVRRLRRAGLR